MQLLKTLLDLGPLAIFFAFYSFSDEESSKALMSAIPAFMVATVISLIAMWLVFKKVAVMPLVSGVIVMIFGGLSLYLENETFFKMKPTIVYGIFTTILASGLFLNKPFLKFLFDEAFQLSNEGWHKLTIRWALFFIFLAGLNEIVWRNFSTDTWVIFKVAGFIPLTLAFAIAQLGLIKTYHLPSEDEKKAKTESSTLTDPSV